MSSAPTRPAPDRKPLFRAVLTLAAVGLVACVVGLLIGFALVGRHGTGPIHGLDGHVERWFTDHRYTVALAKLIATVGDAPALGVICVVVSVGWLLWRRTPLALAPIVAYLGGEGEVFLIREFIHRPRPLTATPPAALPGVHETSWSFPSGHATAVTAVLIASLGVLALTRHVIWPWVVAALASIYVASTRLVLGVHWFSDVCTGLLIGAALGVAVAIVLTRLSWDDLRLVNRPHSDPAKRNERPRHAVATTTSVSGPSTGP